MNVKPSSHHPLALSTLGMLLLSQLLIAAPHAIHLPIWIIGLFLGLSGWRWMASSRTWKMPPTWVRVIAIIVGTGGVLLTHGGINGREPGVSLLLVMISLKLLELRTQRDEMVLVLLGYFLLLTTFLFYQSIATAVYMLGLALINTALLISISDPLRPPIGRKQIRTGAILIAQGLPLMVILFFLFPRLDNPLWAIPNDKAQSVSGLSDSMSPGAFSNLTRSSETAFRVDFTGERPPLSSLYWRGPVFWKYDGWTWRKGGPSGPRSLQFDNLSNPIDYQVTLEPHDRLWLFGLDVPYRTSAKADFTLDYRFETHSRVEKRLIYNMRSYLNYQIEKELPEEDRRLALQLPEGRHPQAVLLGQAWRKQYGDKDGAIVTAALKQFRNQPFKYTLSPSLLKDDPVDEFLFDTKEGFCEHYSGAFTILMRAAGIPSRVVTGYQGGFWNKLGGYFMVRQADAHAWSEVWLRDRGWVRVDPTAAVSPERVEQGISAALRGTNTLPLFIQSENQDSLFHTLTLGWDALQTGWNRWVIGYSSDRQKNLMNNLGLGRMSMIDMVRYLMMFMAGVLILIALGMFLRIRRHKQDPASAAWRKTCARLAKLGLAREIHEGPVDYVNRISGELKQKSPGKEKELNHIADLYTRLRYSAETNSLDLNLIKRAVTRFHP